MSLEEEFGIATNNALIIADLHLEEFEKWWKENNLEIDKDLTWDIFIFGVEIGEKYSRKSVFE